jgi:hypothetical protein
MHDQLWWLNRPMCLEWREKADETPNAFRCLVELVRGIHDALAPTRAPEPRANQRDRRARAGIASGRRWQASRHRRNI